MAEIKWIKIATDIFDDEKILLIESMPDADALIVVWLKLLVLAGKCNCGGVLKMDNAIPYTEEMLSSIFRRPMNTVRLALNTFERYGMIEIVNDIITIPKWEKHQAIDGMEKIRADTRERVRRHREKQRMLITGKSEKLINRLSEEESDKIFRTFEDADRLIDAVQEDVEDRGTYVEAPFKYIVGYAKNTGWPRQ